MFPYKTETLFLEQNGPGGEIYFNNEKVTILGIAMQQSNVSSYTVVKCGNYVLAKNYATNFSQILINYECEDGIVINKTGNDSASINVVYVKGFTSEATTTYQYIYGPTQNISTSSDVAIYGSISAGEVLIVLFLLFLIVIELLKGIIAGLSKIKTKRKYLQYGGGDVEQREDL